MTNSHPMSPVKHEHGALVWLIVSGVVLLLDQLSKYWVLTTLPEHTAVPVFEGWWNWFRSYNTGAAFSFLADAGGWQKYFFVGLALAVTGLLAYWLSKTPRRHWQIALPYALVIGGAVSNVIDRLVRGHVVDFIQWFWRDFYWPAFNLADAAIVAGAVGIAAQGFFAKKNLT